MTLTVDAARVPHLFLINLAVYIEGERANVFRGVTLEETLDADDSIGRLPVHAFSFPAHHSEVVRCVHLSHFGGSTDWLIARCPV